MFSFARWSVVTCGVLCLAGCAAAQVDDMPEDSGSGNKPSSPKAGSGGGGSGGAGTVPKGGPSNSTAGTTAKAGTGSGGEEMGGSAGSGGGGGGSGGMKMVPPANTNLPYAEDFEDGTPQGFIPWNEDMMTATATVWNVVDDATGKIYQPTAAVSELEFAVGGSTTWSDVKLTVKVRLADADSRVHLLLRMKEPKTYLVVEMAEGTYKLRGRADGSTTDIVAPSPKPVITAGTWYTVGVSAKGTAVELTLDDMSIGTGSCNALITNGGIALGVAEGNAAFDDVNVVVAE